MSNIPKIIRINADTYKVNVVDGPILVDNRACNGSINYNNGQIDLLSENYDFTKVLMHEIVHGILSNLGYLELNEDEQLVDRLADSITLLIKNNPNLIVPISNNIIMTNNDSEENE